MKELIYSRMFLSAADRYSNRTAIIDGEHRSTYQQHAERTLRLTRALGERLDVRRTDRFAVMALNSHEYFELYHAAFLGGGIINPLNLRLAGKELDYIIRDSGTEVIFADAFFAGAIRQALDESDEPNRVRQVVLIGEGDVPHDLTYAELIDGVDTVVPEEPEEDDPVVLMYTGGTTGLPKGVLLDNRAEILNLYHVAIVFGFEEDAVNLVQTPMFHAASMAAILATPTSGGTAVTIPLFDPAGVMALIEAHGVTQTVMVPTMIGMLLAHPEFSPERLRSLRQMIYGASPMPAAVLDTLLSSFPDLEVIQGYGMTECSSVLTILGAKEHRKGGDRLRSAGLPLPGTSVSIRDDDGAAVAKGETGEVWARGGNFMTEYWNKPEATAEAFEGGWYHTGDAGYVDDEGYLFLVDRVKDMIVTGGENVYSAEVESALSKHPSVEQVAVIGIPHDMWGEQVHAVVVLVAGAEADAEGLQAFARESIAGYKVPKSVEFRVEPLPLSGAMKVLKKDLRAPYWEGHGRAVN
jgi:long-chain acyl-CoA synthetase